VDERGDRHHGHEREQVDGAHGDGLPPRAAQRGGDAAAGSVAPDETGHPDGHERDAGHD